MALSAATSMHMPLLQTSNSSTQNSVMMAERRERVVLQTKRKHDGGPGRDPQTNSISLLKSTTTTQRRDGVLQKGKKHDPGEGRGAQTN
ncbi:hypothetical protein VNO78_13501 [Psophocarpus tetragonolobus]|uniref:Uncharacterized protein n=1 Tax=Psophocarpus tetragonolobus TaxID=3891 RepID=A0AAN9SR87_PSOTE